MPAVSVAVNLRTYVEAARSGICRVKSLNTGEECVFSSGEPPSGRSFCDYIKSASLASRINMCLDGVIKSDIPIGAGMASSAALLVAVVGALMRLSGLSPDPGEVAEIAYIAEREILGVPCGRLDQYGSSFGYTTVIYPRSPVRVERLRLPGGVLVALDSGIRHSTTEIHPKRQKELQEAVYILKEELGIRAEGYWDFPWTALYSHLEIVDRLPSPLRERVLFTIEMQKSTEEAIEILKTGGDLKRLGQILTLQHRLLSELYDVSLPYMDALVERAIKAGAYGAKLSGAGLGGVVVALAPDEKTAEKIGREAGAPRWWIVKEDRGLDYGN